MRDLRSYIVRIYRQGAHSLAGVVEQPGTGIERHFQTAEELWDLLFVRDVREKPKSRGTEDGTEQ